MWFVDAALNWLGVTLTYVIAGALVVGGVYLAAVWRFTYLGFVAVTCGLCLGFYNLGTQNGGANVEARWQAKNLEAQIARLRLEAAGKDLAAKTAEEQARSLKDKNDEAQGKITDYESSVAKLSASLASCRRATDDDVRRLCDITGRSAAGCQSSK